MATREQIRGCAISYLTDLAEGDRVAQFNDLYHIFARTFGQAPSDAEQRILLEIVQALAAAGALSSSVECTPFRLRTVGT